MKINFQPSITQEIGAGDLVQIKEFIYLVVTGKFAGRTAKESFNQDPGYELISLTENAVYDHVTFSHPLHILNHLKKHYPENYKIIKANKVELNIKG